ncbi:MAG: prepilin peptidase [Parcubacteria group bacterium]|nr:prepilin peptidase [Parcubacteria group bacterium]
MEAASVISFFVFGLIVGSFLNVLVMRLGTGMPLFGGRSRCFTCGRTLSWYELIPLASFVIQRARCRTCRARISWHYPAVELLTGVVFAATASVMFSVGGVERIPALLFYLAIFSLLIAIVAYDIRHKIIPDALVYTFDGAVFLNLLGGESAGLALSERFVSHAFAGLVFFGVFAALWFFSGGRWMGLGDGKLALGIGLLLGFDGGIAALLVSFWAGALAGLFLLALRWAPRLFPRARRFTMKSEIPFAPFLVFGAMLAFFFSLSFGGIREFLYVIAR